MRLFQFIVAGLIVVAGLVGGLLLVAAGFVIFVLRRLFGRPAAMPHFQASFRTSRPAPPRARPGGEVIDVVATEVKDQPTLR